MHHTQGCPDFQPGYPGLISDGAFSPFRPFRAGFSVGLSALWGRVRLYTQRCAGFQPACTGLTADGAFSPFRSFRAGFSVGLSALWFYSVVDPPGRQSTSPYLSVHIRTLQNDRTLRTLRTHPYLSVLCRTLASAVATCGGVDRYFVRMVTDMYGADGLPRRNEMKPGVMQQPSVRCI